jgi:hypothetical protein
VIAQAASRADVEPVAHETLDRVITGLVTGVPVLVLGVAAWQVWDRLLGWHDIVVFAVMYVATGLGVTVGFHRHLTHRSFETSRGCAPPSQSSVPPRSRGRSSRGLPTTASTMRSPTRREIPTAHTWATAAVCAAPFAGLFTLISAGSSFTTNAAPSAATPQTFCATP